MDNTFQTSLTDSAAAPTVFKFGPKIIWVLCNQFGATAPCSRTASDPMDLHGGGIRRAHCSTDLSMNPAPIVSTRIWLMIRAICASSLSETTETYAGPIRLWIFSLEILALCIRTPQEIQGQYFRGCGVFHNRRSEATPHPC